MTRPPRWVGPSLLILICLGSLLLWIRTHPLFTPSTLALRSIAVAFALPGLSLFATNLVLGARIPPVEWLFAGLDRLYAIHRRVGVTATLLLVAHGVLITLSVTATSLPDGFKVVLLGQGWKVSLGVIALSLLVGAVLTSFYVPVAHPTFVWIQRAMGPLFGLGAAHALLVKQASRPLTLYLLGLATVGGGAYLFRSVLGRLVVPRHRYRLEAVNRLADDTAELMLAPLRAGLRHRPGQFAFLTVAADIHREAHPFSIASGRDEDRLRVVVKALGDYTREVQKLPAGGEVLVEGPYGSFAPLDWPNPRQVWIAGGIGITPFLSAARSLAGIEREIDLDLYYCTDRAEQALFQDELFEIADRTPRMRVIPIRRSDLGYITADDIDGASHVRARSEIFICGPPEMMRSLHRQLRALGLQRGRIHFEDFRFV